MPDFRPATIRDFLDRLLAGAKPSAGPSPPTAKILPPLPPRPPSRAAEAGAGHAVVDAAGGGDHRTIADAIAAAAAGTLIKIRPGVYREGIELTKAVEVVGDGPRFHRRRERHGDAVYMKTADATIRNVSLRCAAGRSGKKYYGVDAAKGRIVLEDCDITSDSLACVAVHGADTDAVVPAASCGTARPAACSSTTGPRAWSRIATCSATRWPA